MEDSMSYITESDIDVLSRSITKAIWDEIRGTAKECAKRAFIKGSREICNDILVAYGWDFDLVIKEWAVSDTSGSEIKLSLGESL